jgi:quercetin dioxygenase-like cupin family protein
MRSSPHRGSAMRKFAVAFLGSLIVIAYAIGQQAGTVEKKGITVTPRLEHLVSGHLVELNGKYKLRVSEAVLDPGGNVAEHHHTGPGIRMVAAGELTYTAGGVTTVYKPGDYFYESGDVPHTVSNQTNAPVRLVNFEILPVNWSGGSIVPVPPSH